MKRRIIIVLSVLLFLLCGCKPEPGVTQQATYQPTVQPTDMPSEEFGDYMNHLVGVDALGRTFTAVSETRQNKYVGCFYWLWFGQHGGNDNYDISKLLQERPDELWDVKGTDNSPLYAFHWWTEPLWGYYDANDRWVIRKQLEMLTAAGVDFLAVDLSNAVVYTKPIKTVMKLIAEYRSEGFDCPQLVAFTHIDSKTVVETLYNEIYSKNYCPEAWWCPYDDGKPYIIAYPNPDTEGVVTKSGVKRGQFSSEIQEFFHFIAPQWPDEDFVADAFPWIDWGRYDQADHTSVMSVSPASGPGVPMSHAVLWKNVYYTKMWGRGWNGKANSTSRIDEGTFFKLQWDHAIESDPEIVFVDGWNEWIAQKLPLNADEIFFADAFNQEFSRDVEPMKGGYGDNYFMQLAQNVRAYKGIAGESTMSQSNVTFTDGWDAVKAIYKDFGSNNDARSCKAAWGSTRYTQAAGRVNMQTVQVAHDAENIWVRITAQNEIGEYNGNSWMNIFIGTGIPALKGWNGYEYVINRTAKGSVERLNEACEGTAIGECEVQVEGNVMIVRISRSLLGLTDMHFYFKLADGIEQPTDIMDYYVSGQALPLGRLSFSYKGY